MGTRSLTCVLDEDNNEICTIYKQMDGYPSGLGQIYFDLFGDYTIVNGLTGENPKVANGMNCLAAQIVAYLKMERLKYQKKRAKQNWDGSAKPKNEWDTHDGMAGGIYLYPPGTRDCWEDYIYTFYMGEGHILMLKVEEIRMHVSPGLLYDGAIKDFGEWLEKLGEGDE